MALVRVASVCTTSFGGPEVPEVGKTHSVATSRFRGRVLRRGSAQIAPIGNSIGATRRSWTIASASASRAALRFDLQRAIDDAQRDGSRRADARGGEASLAIADGKSDARFRGRVGVFDTGARILLP